MSPASLASMAPTRSAEAPAYLDCVHCGLCLSSCPTFLELGTEPDGPRGRIHLMRAVQEGRLAEGPEVRRHLDLCLDCRACESACPSGVRYSRLLESYRQTSASAGRRLGELAGLAVVHLFPFRRRSQVLLRLARGLQDMGWWPPSARLRLPIALRDLTALIPPLGPRRILPERLPAHGRRRARVALFVGCVGDALFPQVTEATARVLQFNGCDVWIPRGQTCCGALAQHAGRPHDATRFAERNIRVFSARIPRLDAIIVNAAGCAAAMKDYAHLLAESPAAGRAATLAAHVRDVSEFLANLGPTPPAHELRLRATYHDACHLCHAQQLRRPPRQLLESIPGLELVPLAECEVCCGAAGTYNLSERDMAERLGRRKASCIQETGAAAVFAANPGCLLQISRHLHDLSYDARVAHPVEALWAAYRGHGLGSHPSPRPGRRGHRRLDVFHQGAV